jgi:hypothetical protein
MDFWERWRDAFFESDYKSGRLCVVVFGRIICRMGIDSPNSWTWISEVGARTIQFRASKLGRTVMMIRVPARGFNGLGFVGLGDDTTGGDFLPPDTGTTIDIPTFGGTTPIIDVSGGGVDLSLPSSPLDLSLAPSTPLSQPTIQQLTAPNAVPSQSQLQQIVARGTGSGLSPAQIAQVIGSASQAGVSILKATSAPYAIPGTNLVYNPATGQILPGSGGIVSTPFGVGGVSSSGIMIIGAAVIGLVLIMSMKK